MILALVLAVLLWHIEPPGACHPSIEPHLQKPADWHGIPIFVNGISAKLTCKY